VDPATSMNMSKGQRQAYPATQSGWSSQGWVRCSSSSSVLEVVAYFEELVDLGAGHRRWEDQHVTACASAPTWNSAAFNGASNAAAMAEPLSAATVASNMSLRLMRHRGPSLRTHITKSSTTPSKLDHQSAGRQINCDPCDRHTNFRISLTSA
jgi:hypothetical protein